MGAYVLGHTAHELKRLQTQALLIDPITRRFFAAAGLEPGMNVLDVGSGAGDVTFLVASMVGPSGSVLGVDRSSTAVGLANDRLRSGPHANVSFRIHDPFSAPLNETFDAVVGRFVLQFQSDPVAALAAVAACARSGGLVAFHEIDWGGIESYPPVMVYDRVCGWARAALVATQTETRMGIKLFGTFLDAGLHAPHVARNQLLGAGQDAVPVASLIVDLANTLRSVIIDRGIASASELDEALAALTLEASGGSTVLVAHGQVCVWATSR